MAGWQRKKNIFINKKNSVAEFCRKTEIDFLNENGHGVKIVVSFIINNMYLKFRFHKLLWSNSFVFMKNFNEITFIVETT